MKALLLWKLGRNRVAQINHRASGTPSISYLRTRSTVPPVIPPHKFPTMQEIEANVDSTLHGILTEWVDSGRTLRPGDSS